MSHPATAHVADWFAASADTDGSVGNLLTSIPMYSDDALPDTLSVYDEWRDDWVAAGELPDADDSLADITTPCIAVLFNQQAFSDGPYAHADAAGMAQDGTITLHAFIAVRGPLRADTLRQVSYLARATHGSLLSLGMATDTQRTITGMGIRLGRVQNITRSRAQFRKGDITGVTGWDVTYAITESVPVSF